MPENEELAKYQEGIANDNETKEHRKPLKVYPIFRENALYSAMFPEIEPLFKATETPSAKKIFDAILQHPGEEIVFDDTCYTTIEKEVSIEDLPADFGLTTDKIDLDTIAELFKEKYNTSFSSEQEHTIDERIRYEKDWGISKAVAEELFEIAKHKNENIEQVYILTDHLADHVDDDYFPKDQVLEVLETEAKHSFNLEPLVVESLDEMPGPHVQIVVDRHHDVIKNLNWDKEFPKQITLLPIESEISNIQRELGINLEQGDINKILRAPYEIE